MNFIGRPWKQALIFIVLCSPLAMSQTEDLKALLRNIHAVGTHANEEEGPAAIAVIGEHAFPVVVGEAEGKTILPVVAAARFGKGRVVALAEKGLLGDVSGAPVHDDDKFLANAIAWVRDGKLRGGTLRDDNTRIRVIQLPGMAEHLRAAGYAAAQSDSSWSTSNCDVIVAAVDTVSAAQATDLRKFLTHGGGLILAASVSHWEDQSTNGETVAEYPGNAILAPVGILWTDVDVRGNADAAYAARQDIPPMASVSPALLAIRTLREGKTPSAAELDQASRVLMTTAGIVPAEDRLFLPLFRKVMEGFHPDHFPSAKNPVAKADVLTRLAIALDRRNMDVAHPEKMRPYPSAAEFPGAVPSTAKAVTKNIVVDTSHPRWHSTGLYAAPGQIILVDVPASAVNHGLKVRIGAHTDTLWHLDRWERFPDISLVFPIRGEHVRAANPFGGLVYLEVPEKTAVSSFTATVSGAVESARFVLGETTPEQWAQARRDSLAPWGEVESGSLILTAPLADLKKLDNPDELLGFWDKIMMAQADLAGWSPVPASPERIVFDQQISAGYLHSGYPVMGPLSLASPSLSTAYMQRSEDFEGGRWGYYHELGHNHQSDDWTFRGTVEVTVNLFSLYSFEAVNGVPVAKNPRGSAEFRKKEMAHLDWKNPDFSKLDPFQALVMYEQLQQAFGWDTFKTLFRKYRALLDAERPKTDLEKRDRWMVEFSHQVGKNLGPFFQAWGVETTPEARASIRNLPCWAPEELPVQPCAVN
ncbi:MAG: M60 family metallopeptidase [Terriglobales bacterium]|jgi:hypothetical protein